MDLSPSSGENKKWKRNYYFWFFRHHWNMSRTHRNRSPLFRLLLKTETDAFSETSCFFRPETMDSVRNVSHVQYTLIFAWSILQHTACNMLWVTYGENTYVRDPELASLCWVVLLDRPDTAQEIRLTSDGSVLWRGCHHWCVGINENLSATYIYQ
jgi:hypothetical protein